VYLEGRLSPQQTPWDLLFGLSVLDRRREELPAGLSAYCAKLESWPGDRTLVQVLPGFSARLADEYVQAARLLGLTAVQELVPGGYDRPAGNRVPVRRSVVSEAIWPTPLRPDGTARTSAAIPRRRQP
jgi:hypothetical protein